MQADEYRLLVGGEEQGRCGMYHGEGGRCDNPLIPRLDILSPTYIETSLWAYRDGLRASGIMAEASSDLGTHEIARLANSFSQTKAHLSSATDPKLIEHGARLARNQLSQERPACIACHGPWPSALNPAFPALAGQHAAYIEGQLRLWRNGPRGGSRLADAMHDAVATLSDKDIEALSAYYSGLERP